jgi:hypothetical protein
MEIVRWMSLTFDEIRSPNSSLCLVSEGLKSMVALRKVTAGSTEVTLLDADAARILIEGFVPPSALVTSSVLDHIDAHMRHFIEASPLCFISSADADGVQEVSVLIRDFGVRVNDQMVNHVAARNLFGKLLAAQCKRHFVDMGCLTAQAL